MRSIAERLDIPWHCVATNSTTGEVSFRLGVGCSLELYEYIKQNINVPSITNLPNTLFNRNIVMETIGKELKRLVHTGFLIKNGAQDRWDFFMPGF